MKKQDLEKYSNLSLEKLEQMKNRGLELKDMILSTFKKKQFRKFKEYSKELETIVTDLQMYEKYLKLKEQEEQRKNSEV